MIFSQYLVIFMIINFVLIIELSSEKHAVQNIQNDCYEGLSDSCRVHQIRFRPGLRPGPAVGAHDTPPDPLGSRLGRGTPSPHSPSPSTPSATRPRRLVPKIPPKFFFSGYGPVRRYNSILRCVENANNKCNADIFECYFEFHRLLISDICCL